MNQIRIMNCVYCDRPLTLNYNKICHSCGLLWIKDLLRSREIIYGWIDFDKYSKGWKEIPIGCLIVK